MSVFFIASLLLVIALSFGTTDSLGGAHFGASLANVKALGDPVFLKVAARSLVYSVLTAVLCLALGYPVAYAIALHGGRYKNALIAADRRAVLRELPGPDVRLVGGAVRQRPDPVAGSQAGPVAGRAHHQHRASA